MILFIHKSERITRPLVEMFRHMGLLAQRKKPTDALAEVSALYSAVVILHPEALAAPEEYVCQLRSYSGRVPLFALTDRVDDSALCNLFSMVFPMGTPPSKIVFSIRAYCSSQRLSPLGHYRLSGFNVSFDTEGATYFEKDFSLTRTERRILQFFIRMYPARIQAKDMLEYVFPLGRLPDVCTVRTHICSINRKFRTAKREPHPSAPKNILIDLVQGEGYRLTTLPLAEDEPFLLHHIKTFSPVL